MKRLSLNNLFYIISNMISIFPDQSVALQTAQIMIVAFMAILFLQSGIDKIVDWKGNLTWLKEHFAKSPLRSTVPVMLATVTITEILAGVLCLVGGLTLLNSGSTLLAYWGLVLAGLNILFLFFGQRLAKDYVGAAVLVNYFILVIIGLLLLA